MICAVYLKYISGKYFIFITFSLRLYQKIPSVVRFLESIHYQKRTELTVSDQQSEESEPPVTVMFKLPVQSDAINVTVEIIKLYYGKIE